MTDRATGSLGRAVLGTRIAVYLLSVTLAALSETARQDAPSLAALAVLMVAASLPYPDAIQRWIPVAEAVTAAAIVVLTQPLNEALLPYLLAPSFAAGVLGGLRGAILATGLASLILLAAPTVQVGVSAREYIESVLPWPLLAVATGLLGSWVARLEQERATADAEAYAAAYRLLSQLQPVARKLSSGLDVTTIAEALLESVRSQIPYSRSSVVLLREDGGVVTLVESGDPRPHWRPDLADGSILHDAVARGVPAAAPGTLSGAAPGYWAALTLRSRDRTLALIGLERNEAPFETDVLTRQQQMLAPLAGQLETAALFSEVQSVAATEERRRIAREIHDGVAQELASVGYAIDEAISQARDADTIAALRSLRGEVTRLISELRLSLFDLRSDVSGRVSLGSALGDYVRGVSSTSDMRVQLVLDERGRLAAAAETELLRIAQEAVTNARRHAQASTLWVELAVDAPDALLRISDDGRGLGKARADSFGLGMMRERADRIGASLQVRSRPGGGTSVEVSLDSTGSERADEGDQSKPPVPVD